ncbi:hypothetical protein F5Y03DRAFT_398922 [Xylaria venustula]|nr:hypothetical protein F5Y03DRAFT_398922 [Xylaria venustula]
MSWDYPGVLIYSTKATATSNVVDIETTRALIQVNHESRDARGSGDFDGNWEKPSFHKFFFVYMLFDEAILAKIKHVAVEIGKLDMFDGKLIAPAYRGLGKETTPKPLDKLCAYLPSLKTIFLALNHSTVYELSRELMLHERDWPDEFDSDDTDYDESLARSNQQVAAEMRMEVTDWITSLPEYKFGYHRVEPKKRCYALLPLSYYSGRDNPPPKVQTDFGTWVHELLLFAKEDVIEAYRREHKRYIFAADDLEGLEVQIAEATAKGYEIEMDLIEVQMVMDHHGAFEERLHGYYRKRKSRVH